MKTSNSAFHWETRLSPDPKKQAQEVIFSRKTDKINHPPLLFFFFNWDSLHARLNSHYEAWSYKKRSTKNITGHRKFV